jgi:5-(carboxyamino)imidazole ribonucleotide synthase
MPPEPPSSLQQGLPRVLQPGDTVGILGGGQLGRMLAMAAARIGLRCHVYCDAETSPAGEVASRATAGDYNDFAALSEFAASVNVVTYEFENVPVAAAQHLAGTVGVFPPPRALEVAQDRLVEKQFVASLGLPVAPFIAVGPDGEPPSGTAGGRDQPAYPAILKTRRMGYDGKGQLRLQAPADLPQAAAGLGGVPAILEGLIRFERELSVILVRGRGPGDPGEIVEVAYDVPLNTHRDGILDISIVPAPITAETQDRALQIATTIARATNYIGVLAVELFDTGATDGSGLIVNEIAPRVHNSGHWTMDACAIDQFENHIRAVAGWPLGTTGRHSDAEMHNLIGADVHAWERLLAEPGTVLHLYGKQDARPGRKMGHYNRVKPKSSQ